MTLCMNNYFTFSHSKEMTAQCTQVRRQCAEIQEIRSGNQRRKTISQPDRVFYRHYQEYFF